MTILDSSAFLFFIKNHINSDFYALDMIECETTKLFICLYNYFI